MELTIKFASLCFDLFNVELIKGITIEDVIPRRETASINSKKVNPPFLIGNFLKLIFFRYFLFNCLNFCS